MRVDIQFTARKRDPRTGEPYRWRWGAYRTVEELEVALARAKKQFPRRGKVTLVERGWVPASIDFGHAERTRDGMARARARGRPVGRPRASFDAGEARRAVERASRKSGKTRALREVARRMKVSVSTLERALRVPSKGVPRTSEGSNARR